MFTTSIMFITNIPYLFEMTKKNKLSSQKRLAIAGFFAIFIALLFMISSVPAQAGTEHSQQETGFTTSVNYIPNPEMNANITWSTHYAKWGVLEYNNSKENLTLNAHLNSQYANPISINPSDIISNALTGKSWAGQDWENTANWTANAGYGGTSSISNPTTGGIEVTMNGSKAGNTAPAISGQEALVSQLPTSNTQYLYETISGYSTTSTKMTGTSLTFLMEENSNNYPIALNGTQIMNSSKEGTLGTTTIPTNEPFMLSFPVSDFASSLTNFNELTTRIAVNIPTQTVSNNYVYLHITGESITTHIMSLGTNDNEQVQGSFGNVELNTLDPTFQYSSIVNDGYSVAISQPMQNITESQTSINNGIYTEEATYQGTFELPTAPDLTYQNALITMQMNESGKQFLVANMNGISYTTSIQTKNNGTFVFGTVNPNNQNTVILEVEYTTSQWTSSSGAPSFWTIQGVEYYWYLFLGGALGLIGLGTGISKHANTLRVGKR